MKRENKMGTIKDFIREHYDSSNIRDICGHGMGGGWAPLIHYTETSAFYDDHEEEIWSMLQESMEVQGYKSIFELISSFRGAENVQDYIHFKNFLCWYAVEEKCLEIMNSEEEKESDE